MDLPRMQQRIRILNLETNIPTPEISSIDPRQFAEFKHRRHRRFDLHLQEMFFEALTPGGFLCLGHSESMSRISSIFMPRKFQDSIVYQKPAAAE